MISNPFEFDPPLHTFSFLFTSIQVLLAQGKTMLNNWHTVDASVVSDLPSIGLAGQSALIRYDRLFILGGSNFPDAMPWQGGKKNIMISSGSLTLLPYLE